MSQPTTCFFYAEDKLNPGSGSGHCFKITEMVKDDPFPNCRKCADVLREGKCPRGKKSPYLNLKRGERA